MASQLESSKTEVQQPGDGKYSSDSYLMTRSRIRVSDLQEAKRRGEKWSMLTCYDTISARIFDHAQIPCLLIGDSAAQTVYGYKSTLPVSVDELIPLARAVALSCERAFVVADLPFGSYQESPRQALRTATRFMKEAMVHGVKLEGGQEVVEHVRLLTSSGIPVMAHLGFTPQSEHTLGGFKVQGKDSGAMDRIWDNAKKLQSAGAFACVLELVPSSVGSMVTKSLTIPTVGIGAGPDCDAQVLVWQDMVGFTPPKSAKATSYMTGKSEATDINENHDKSDQNGQDNQIWHELELNRVPKFVKRYGNVSEIIYNAAISFANDVRSGKYPSKEHCYE